MNPLIISLAVDGREQYSQKIKALEKSLEEWTGDVKIYKEFPDWCTKQYEIPYAFKYDLMGNALMNWYKKIFWLDSSMRLVKGKDINELLDNSEHGIVAFDNIGHPLEKYINDTAIKNLEIGNLEEVKQIWGGAIFFDFNKPLPNIIFEQIKYQIKLGSFNDDNTTRKNFIAHRHDQAIISWLLHLYKVELLPYGIIAAKQHITEQTYIQYAD